MYGPEPKAQGEGEIPFAWVEVYRLTGDRGAEAFRAEQVRSSPAPPPCLSASAPLRPRSPQAARWKESHPGDAGPPSAWDLAHVDLQAALQIVRSYAFPFT